MIPIALLFQPAPVQDPRADFNTALPILLVVVAVVIVGYLVYIRRKQRQTGTASRFDTRDRNPEA